MAQLSKPAIPPKMYRHFAVVTFVLTGLLAFMASTTNTDAGDRPNAAPTTRGTPETGPTPAYGQSQLQVGEQVEIGNSYEMYQESGPAGGGGGSISSGRGVISEIGATQGPRSGSENAGFTREYLDSLSDEELDELLRQLQAAGASDPAARAQMIQVLEAGSRRRTGRATPMG